MDSAVVIIVALVVGLAAGAGLGWFFASRPAADLATRLAAREAELRELDERFRRAIADLAGASVKAERADALADDMARVRAEHAAMQAELATASERAAQAERVAAELPALRAEREALRAEVGSLAERVAHTETAARELADVRAEREKLKAELATLQANAENFAEQKRLLLEAQETLKKEFQNAGAKVLEGAQEAFLRRAQDRFAESEKTSAQRLQALLAPVGERLQKYEQQVQELETKRVDAFGQLAGLIQSMRDGQEQVRAEAARLGNSLRNAPKARGRWGEQQLRNVLEQCGLSEHTDFVTEHSITTEDGRLRPDAIVHIPGQKKLIIDAKVSLNAYQEAFEAQDDLSREAALAQHVNSMRTHVQQLGAKSYQSQFEEAPDYVVMFVPGEHFVAAALEKDPDLWEFAFRNKVLLATPTNLVAIARTVAQVWRQDGLAREAREIGRMGGELYDRLAVAAEHLKRVGSGLNSAVDNYNKFVGSFERNVLSAGRRLRDKHIEIGKREIEEIAEIESRPRHAGAAPALPPADGDELPAS